MPKIGTYLVEKNILSNSQVNSILRETNRKGIRKLFGRIAIDKGFASESAINSALLDLMREETFGRKKSYQS
ncbi:MAG: hypothetical protein JXR70_19650 [Spirochaetales bacterium]|nr:hypothetical protein [Spirochaetales bacterium]